MKGIFSAESTNKTGKIIFNIFLAVAIVVFIIGIILSIWGAAEVGSFYVFLERLLTTVINTVIIYGIGKIIDLHYVGKSE